MNSSKQAIQTNHIPLQEMTYVLMCILSITVILAIFPTTRHLDSVLLLWKQVAPITVTVMPMPATVNCDEHRPVQDSDQSWNKTSSTIPTFTIPDKVHDRKYFVVGYRFLLGTQNNCTNSKPMVCRRRPHVSRGSHEMQALRGSHLVQECHCTVSKCITAIVKTNSAEDRVILMKRMLQSLRLLYPDLRIICVDDKTFYAPYWQHVAAEDKNFVYLPLNKSNTGISRGRNAALSLVNTKYALILDDDQVFTPETNLSKLLDILETTDLTVVGGRYQENQIVFEGLLDIKTDRRQPGKERISHYRGALAHRIPGFDSCYAVDLVSNFFLADTQRLRAFGGWDENRPLCEHLDFFLQVMMRSLKVAICLDVTVRHVQPKNHDLIWRNRKLSCESLNVALASKWAFSNISICKIDWMTSLTTYSMWCHPKTKII